MINRSQLIAAARLYRRLPHWTDADKALTRLKDTFPSNTNRESVLLKVSAVDALYATRVGRIYAAADHVCMKLRQCEKREWLPGDSIEFVHELAKVPKETCRNGYELLTSFASKYAHFFVDPASVDLSSGFPIYDSYAAMALLDLLGLHGDLSQRKYPYAEFCGLLAQVSSADPGSRPLDRYLWLKGQHLAFLAGNAERLNRDVLALFRSTDEAISGLIRELGRQDGEAG